MNGQYTTIKEACVLTGKSESTIRRNITNIANKINQIEGQKTVFKDNGVFKIDYSYLIKKYPLNNQKKNTYA